jgi:ketosteroid isomerase-like protein
VKYVAIAVLWSAFALAPCQAAAPVDSERQLLKLHTEWAAARVNGDATFVETFYGRELRLNQSNGGVVHRDTDIALFKARAIKPDFIRDNEMKVSLYGEAAVVTGVESLQGTYKGSPGKMSLRFTNVLVWRDRRWQLVAHQSTQVSRE